MKHKNTTNALHQQQFPAGLAANDHNIEFVGNTQDKTIIWIRCGHSNPFKTLPNNIYQALEELLLTDHEAIKFLTTNYESIAHDMFRIVELYTYYMYGQLDNKPDVVNGLLQAPENFRESENCPSLKFENTFIDINGVHLSTRDLNIIDNMIKGFPDKLIAYNLGIAQSTFDFHKRNLFKRLHINSKLELVVESFKNKVALCVE
ncbi:helix-turn-helix transcriptional regulator [Psychroserpens burtonensis]|uniref:Helix-turn-helix transcriptional regulator n=1 Tax=Psychroserpens burtonensis TaxID=49278 RepID=A0A5C7BDC6_9FLAO|nr:helix-turn-helix transcriptional regulator [Psychroserpens burtonensis]TXE18589.1 helix-turn-helix transcriptional regulator [Psychroserpens burtonensis]